MAEKTINLTNFSGTISDQEKRGLPGSARFMKNLNPHEDDAYLTPTPKLSKVSGSTVTGLVKWAVDTSPWATDRYFYDENGDIYKETSAGAWSLDRDGSVMVDWWGGEMQAGGQGLAVYDDGLYYATSTTIGRKSYLSGTPTYRDNFVAYLNFQDDQRSDAGGYPNTYTFPSSITENATNTLSFTPTVDPIDHILVGALTIGTGTVTMTLHDADHNVIGTSSPPLGHIAGEDCIFAFSPQARITPGETYHFHITQSGTGGKTDDVVTSNDLSTVLYVEYFGVLVNDDFHPMREFLNMLCIGNDRYLATWDGATYEANRLVMAPQYRVRALNMIDEYLVIGCARGTNVDDEDLGRVYLWDGIAPTFNFFQDVPVGVVNALANHRNNLLGVYGSSGKIYQGTEEFKELWHVPKLGRGKKIEVFPGAVTNWQGQTMLGIGANTDDATGIEQGVYALGSQDGDHPDVFTLAHTISTGTTQGTGLEIGCVAGFGADLYVGWKDSSTYGVDKVSKTSSPNTSGSYESLIIDCGNPHKEKLAYDVVIEFEDLESGETITPKYQIDRSGSFTSGTTVSTVGANRASVLINKRFKEIEIGFNYAASTTFPKIISVQFNYNDLSEEGRMDR